VHAAATASAAEAGGKPPNAPSRDASPDKELHTAYIQDMLATDPVTALGLRIAGSGSATLEYVSIDEAKQDLRAPSLPAACA
jgi:hypothetical protein